MKEYTDGGSDEVRQSIANAVMELLREWEFEEINVGDICNAAHIGRTTFYRYFGAKSGKRKALAFWLIHAWKESNGGGFACPTER